ncbi:MAG: glycosyl hydrolase family 28-related protein [Verrucomicrobiota bacterium]|jgi:polygalacturonase
MKKTTLLLSLPLLCFVLAGCETADHTVPVPGTLYDVRSFGAIGDGKALDSPAINKAINAAAAAGGGTVCLPAGTYLSGSIELKSNIHLLIEAGATILGAPQSMKAYDLEEPWIGRAYQDGGHTFFHNSLIWGENLTNVSITGQGMINGGDLSRGDGNEDRGNSFGGGGRGQGRGNLPPPQAGGTSFPTNANSNAPFSPNQRLGNKAIALKLCRNVLLRDITIFHGGHFAILVTGCEDMTVDNVTMDTDRDGIDIDCCRNTMVSNCRINSPADDALCPKSSFALGSNVITENLTIVNCQVSGFQEGTLLDGTMKPGQGNGRIKLGTEANGGFRNITIANCTFRGCKGLALEEVDGGIMENITVNNITMMDVVGYPIYITTGRRNRGPNVTEPSRARNIFISNVIATGIDKVRGGPGMRGGTNGVRGAGMGPGRGGAGPGREGGPRGMGTNQPSSSVNGIQIEGMPDQPIENVRLENIRLQFKGGGTAADAAVTPNELGTGYPEPRGVLPGYGVFARHVKGLEMANITVGFDTQDLRPALVGVDVDGLEINNFKAQLAPNVLPARLEGVKGLVVLNSPVLQGVAADKP